MRGGGTRRRGLEQVAADIAANKRPTVEDPANTSSLSKKFVRVEDLDVNASPDGCQEQVADVSPVNQPSIGSWLSGLCSSIRQKLAEMVMCHRAFYPVFLLACFHEWIEKK